MAACAHCGRRSAAARCSASAHSTDDAAASAPHHDPSPAIPGYAELEWLARGGFGEVLRGRRESDGEVVVVKLARLDQLTVAARSLANEAQVLRALGGAHAPRLYESGALPDGRAYLCMSFVAAPTLARIMERRGDATDLEEAHAVGRLVCEAVASMHALGFAHTDLKPENLCVDVTAGRVTLLDFGTSHGTSHSLGEVALEPSHIVGTPEYMAPEQCAGASTDARTDVYALGIILYELFTGRIPFFGAAAEVRQAQQAARPPPPSAFVPLARSLDSIVLRCLAKEPTQRFAHAGEVAGALAAAHASVGSARPSAPVAAPGASAKGPIKRTVGLVFLETSQEPLVIERVLRGAGGVLVHAQGRRRVGVFDALQMEHPARRAYDAALRLVRQGHCRACVVDVAQVTVVSREGVADRYVSAAFGAAERFPPEKTEGVQLSAAAASVLGVERATEPEPELPTLVAQKTVGRATSVSSGPLIGGEQLLEALGLAASEAVEARRVTHVTATGPSGIGKSHLAEAFADHLRATYHSAHVRRLRLREPLDGDVEGNLRSLLAALLEPPAERPADAGRSWLIARVGEEVGAEAFAAVALAMGWLDEGAPELAEVAVAPGALRALVLRAIGARMRRLASEAPLFVVVDDAQFGDDASLDALEGGPLDEAALPICICVLARPALLERRPAFGHAVRRSRRLEVPPLSREAAATLCRLALAPAEDVPALVIERMIDRAGAVPLLILELARSFKAQGLVRAREGSSGYYLVTDQLERESSVPHVEWLAESQLARLSSSQVAHARLCALLGPRFTLREVAGVLSELDRLGATADFPLDASVGLGRLRKAGMIGAHRDGSFAFKHSLAREAIRRGMPEPTRQLIHRAATDYYRVDTQLPESTRLPSLAFHAARCGARTEAAALYAALGQRAVARHAYLDAELLFSQVLELAPPDDRLARVTAQRGRGQMRLRLGRYDAALADLRDAVDVASALEHHELKVELLLEVATTLDWRNDWGESQRWVELAWAQAEAPSPRLSAMLLLGRGRSLWRSCRWSEAREVCVRAAAEAEPLGNDCYETLVVALLAQLSILPYEGRLVDAAQVRERLIALCSAHSDRAHLSMAYNNSRNLWVARDDVAAAVADQERFVSIGRELGMATSEYMGRYNIAELGYQADGGESVKERVDQVVELETRRPDIIPRPVGALLRLRLLAHMGEDATALSALEWLTRQQREAVAADLAGAVFLPSEAVLLDCARLLLQRAPGEDWGEVLARSRQVSTEQEPIEVLELAGLCAARRGETARARALLSQAVALGQTVPNVMGRRLARELAAL